MIFSKTTDFGLSTYFKILAGVLGAPGRFFSQLSDPVPFRRSFGFLLVSSLFFAMGSFVCFKSDPFLMTGIFFVNALFMPFLSAGAAYLIIILTAGNRIHFQKLFAIYAFAGGVTLLVSWIPFTVWFTEPWKWGLIGLGMMKGGGLGWREMVLVIGFSLLILVLVFWAVMPCVADLKGCVP